MDFLKKMLDAQREAERKALKDIANLANGPSFSKMLADQQKMLSAFTESLTYGGSLESQMSKAVEGIATAGQNAMREAIKGMAEGPTIADSIRQWGSTVSLANQTSKMIADIEQERRQEILDLCRSSLAQDWWENTVGNLSAETIAPVPVLPPRVQRPAPEPADNALTFAQRILRQKERIEAQGKAVRLLLYTPEGEELEVGSLVVNDPEMVHFFLIGEDVERLSLRYSDVQEGYQVLVKPVDIRGRSEEKNEGYIN